VPQVVRLGGTKPLLFHPPSEVFGDEDGVQVQIDDPPSEAIPLTDADGRGCGTCPRTG
jgi:hypothetical protein